MNTTPRDPVCGMIIPFPDAAIAIVYNNTTVYFCSEYCKERFLLEPSAYAGRYVREAPEQDKTNRRIAYFSMEVAIAASIPTYAGGLGVLAGDTLRSFADLHVPAVGVTLLYRKGYFRQSIDDSGLQKEHPVEWDVTRVLRPLSESIDLLIENRRVRIRSWRYDIAGLNGYEIPLILLDADLGQNAERDRSLTGWLYGGDQRYRLAQEAVLGMGGVRMLDALGYTGIEKFHLNEGHASLLLIELLRSERQTPSQLDFEAVRNRCVFTTHTPVAAGHDQFDYGLVRDVIGEPVSSEVFQMLAGRLDVLVGFRPALRRVERRLWSEPERRIPKGLSSP